MADREFVAELTRWIDAPPPLVWVLVADTNRYDRAAGLAPPVYEFRELTPGDPRSRMRVGRARQLGVMIEWAEPPYEWIEGRLLRLRREFLSGPVSLATNLVQLVPERGGTRLSVRTTFSGAGLITATLGPIMNARIRGGLRRYVDGVESLLKHAKRDALVAESDQPAAAIARRVLYDAPTDSVTAGKVSPISEQDLAFRVKRLENAPIDPALRDRIVNHLRTRSDDDVSQIRPFELARVWNVDRREVLRAFLHAARAGLVDLNWQLNCPACRVGSAHSDTLASVGRTAHCDACNIDYELDFADHVEAVFKVSSALRMVETVVYCASSPWFRPHVFAQMRLQPGEKRTVEAPLPPGSLLVRTTGNRARANIETDDGAPAQATITLGNDGLKIGTDGRADEGADTAVTLINETDEIQVLSIERRGWTADVVLGSVITTLPDFVDLFATEAPAAGVELTVGALTVLFSDLTGSTAMYERLGDARAFAIVQEHFRLMTEAVTGNRGAIVKTMGDAVMANFSSPTDAMLAAIDMIDKTEAAHGAAGLTVKLGLHDGPCLAVRANERLDYFGTTVNVAARLQAQAHASEIVVLESLLDHPEIARLLRERKYPMRRFAAHLKGIREEQRLVGIDVSGDAKRVASSETQPTAAAKVV